MRSRVVLILLPAALIVSNGLNMMGVVVLPKLIKAQEFALFSLASSIGLFIVSVLFEWSRICIMRYSVTKDATESARRRATLNAANLWTASALILVALAIQLIHATYAIVFGMACLFATSQALFEARQASFRAEFKDVDYIRNVLTRATLGFVLLCAFAFFAQSALFAMFGWAGSFALILLLTKNPLRASPIGRFDSPTLSFMIKFGMGVTASAVATTALSPLLRLVAAEIIPLDESGKMMLAMDISQKIIGVVGVSINLITLQATFRAKEFGDDALAAARVSGQLSIVVAVIVPAVVGFLFLADPFEGIFVPADYRHIYSENITWCMIAAGLVGVRTFALDSIFLVAGRPYLGVVGPVVTGLASLLVLPVLGYSQGFSSVSISEAMAIGALVGLLASALLSRRVFQFDIAWLDILKVGAASTAMYGVMITIPRLADVPFLLIASVIGAAGYGAVMFGTNALGLHRMLRRFPIDQRP
jgi:O-antigen/teichoic acid export membrane protein